MSEFECEHGRHCFRADCLKEFARHERAVAAEASKPIAKRRFKKHVNGFRTVTPISLTIDTDAIAVLEGLCQEDDMNRSRFITNLIMAEGHRRMMARDV